MVCVCICGMWRKDKSDFLVVKKSGTANLVNLLPFINKLRPRKIVTHLCLHRSL